MGNENGKMKDPLEDSPIVAYMKTHYGDGSCEFIEYWCKNCGFPDGGSLSRNQLKQLRDRLEKERKGMYKKRKVKTSKVEMMERMENCLNMWETESDRRERLELQSAMTALKVSGKKKKDKVKENTSAPPSCPSLYLSLQGLWGVKTDPSLDSIPPPYVDPVHMPPPQNQPLEEMDPSDLGGAAGGSGDLRPQVKPETSGINTHSQEAKLEQKTLTTPMVQVDGSDGDPMFVFRPWTADDIVIASKHLPKPTKGGDVLARELHTFINAYSPTSAELSRVMLHLLTTAEFSLVRSVLEGHHQPRTLGWRDTEEEEPEENADYRLWVNNFLGAVRQSFPVRCDLSRVSACRQNEGEPVEEFLARLHAIYDEHSGMERPDPYPGDRMTSYESLLKNYFLTNLQKRLAEATRDSCVGWEDASVRLAEVVIHAQHKQHRQTEKDNKDKKQRAEEKYRAQLQLQQHAAAVSAPPLPPPAEPNYNAPGGASEGDGGCFFCGGYGHWARYCYLRYNRNRYHQGRGCGHQRGRGRFHPHGQYYPRHPADRQQRHHPD